MITEHQAKYFAYELTKRCSSDSVEKFAGAVASAQVDLNPHQVDAALFTFKSPLSKGALLADEVGHGKTIEAGLVLSQKWAENKRRILIITPSNLRKLLASSTFAIAGALTTMSNRLKAKLRREELPASLEDDFDQDYEALDETAEEWANEESVEVLTEADTINSMAGLTT